MGTRRPAYRARPRQAPGAHPRNWRPRDDDDRAGRPRRVVLRRADARGRSALVQGRGHLRAPRPRLLRQQRRRHRRLPRPDREARLPAGPRRHRDLAAAVLPLAAARTTATTSPTTRDVHPDYGTLRDFQRVPPRGAPARAAGDHRAGANHTSDQHPWFQRARRAPRRQPVARLLRLERHARQVPGRADHLQGLRDARTGPGTRSPRRTTGTASTRTSPTSTSTTRRCSEAIFERVDFWLEMGVDGLRLDAVPYLYEREGTNCENLPETHAFLKELRAHIDEQLRRTGCCSPRRTSGRRTPSPTSATATSATWPSTSRSCRGCSWRCAWRTASRSSTSSSRRRRSPRTASGRCSCATTTS